MLLHADPSSMIERRRRTPSSLVEWTARARAADGRQVLADVVGADRQLAVAAVDQDGQLDRARPAEVAERVERGADGAAGEQHVVDEDDDLAVDPAAAGCRCARARGRAAAAGRRGTSSRRASRPGTLAPSTARDPRREPGGERHAAGRDAEQDEVVGALVALEDLVRDAGEGPARCRRRSRTVRAAGATVWARTCRGVGQQTPRPPSPPLGTGR